MVGLAPITTERDEVEFAGLLVANKAFRHWQKGTTREPRFVLSHISKARCGAPGRVGRYPTATGNYEKTVCENIEGDHADDFLGG